MIKRLFSKLIGKGNQAKILKGVIWSFLGTFISKGFIFIALFVVARLFNVEDYGKVGLLQSFISSFSIFSLASFGITATKYLATYSDTDKNKASEIYSLTRVFSFVLAFLMLVLSLVFSKELSFYISDTETLRLEVIIASVAIFFSSLNGLQIGALSGLESFRNISLVNIVNGVLSLPLIIGGAYWYGVTGVISALLIVYFSIWLSSAILLSKELKKKDIVLKLDGLKKHYHILVRFSLPAFLSSIMVTPVILICNSILVKNHSNGLYEMGIYNAAYNFSQLGAILIGIIGQVFTPYAIKNFGKGNKKFDYYNIINSYAIGLLIFIPIIILPDLFMYPYGEKYATPSSYYTLIFLALASIVTAHRQGISRNFIAGNFMWWSVLSNGTWATFTILFTYFFLEKGAEGRALALLLGYLCNTFIFIPFYIRTKLVNKNLLYSKFHYVLLILLIASSLIYFLNQDIFLRLTLIIIIIPSVTYFFYKWYKTYTKHV